jgi:ribosomal protein S18 acetylase RimI-like enzyme
MTIAHVRLVLAAHLSPVHADQVRAIYLDSFPSYERVDFASLLHSFALGKRWLFTAQDDEQVIGFAVIVPYVARAVHLFEYLAVARAARGHSIGGQLLEFVRDTLRAMYPARGMVLEVEDDTEGDEHTRAMRQRRIAFYTRHGARVIEEVPHYRVPMTDRTGTLSFKLLWLPLVADADIPRGAELCECIAGILTQSYGLTTDDALVQAILSDIQDAI